MDVSESVEDVTSTLKRPLMCREWPTVIPDEGKASRSAKFFLKSVECQFTLYARPGELSLDVERTDSSGITQCLICTVLVSKCDLKLPPASIRKSVDIEKDYIWEFKSSQIEHIRGKTISFFVVLEENGGSAQEEGSECCENCKSLTSLSRDFARLLDDAHNADVQVSCGDLTIPAHGTVLSARSEVFQKMLQTDMVEKCTGSIEIPDIRPEVGREFLRYIYTGALPEMTVEKASQLYEAEDKYSVGCLVEECASYLGSNLTKENACEVLALADHHSDAELKERAICFILENEIPLQPDHWEEFSDQRPELALEALHRAYKDSKQK